MTAPDHKLAATEPLVDSIELARSVMEAEARAIQAAALRINGELPSAVNIVLNHRGKLIVTGMGKSGHIGRKLAATLQSTGTPAVFLHAADASHGDVGIYQPGD